MKVWLFSAWPISVPLEVTATLFRHPFPSNPDFVSETEGYASTTE